MTTPRPPLITMAVPDVSDGELQRVIDAVKSGWISSLGRYVTEFEEKFSSYCGVKYGVSTSSGTTALHLALATIGMKPGDEVIIPTLAMIATANSVTYTGARPVLVDAEAETWNMDPAKIEEKITSNTRAIMPVHTYGHPVDMDPLIALAKAYNLYIIEDAAEAHGAEYNGRRAGALGDIGCFSFYANKIITTGEGGMLVTNNEELAERARMLKDQAFEKEKRFWHKHLGFNYRMTNVQAAIGVAQMERIDKFVETRRQNAKLYNSLLGDIPGMTLPPEAPWAKNVYWMYSVLLEDSFGLPREEVMAHLREKGVDSRTFFYPVHHQPLYQASYSTEVYPVADELSRKGVNLPSGNTLNLGQIERVAEAFTSAKSLVRR